MRVFISVVRNYKDFLISESNQSHEVFDTERFLRESPAHNNQLRSQMFQSFLDDRLYHENSNFIYASSVR